MQSRNLVLASLLLGGAASAQSVLNVPSGSYPTIKSAVSAAVDGDTVLVSPGTYLENLIFLNGKKITIQSTGGPAATIIDAQSLNRVFRFNGGEDLNTVLDGFTIKNGQAPTGGGTAGDGGGGILFQSSSPWIKNCVFQDCHADDGANGGTGQTGYRGGHGGALYLINSDVRLERCTFDSNDAGDGGNGGNGSAGSQGTFFYPTGDPGGAAGHGGRGGHGGAIYMDGASSPTIFSSYFVDNRSGDPGYGGQGGPGGAGYKDLLIGFTGKGGKGGRGGNGGSGGDGGSIFAENGATPEVVNCSFIQNWLPEGNSGTPGGPGGPGTSTGAAGATGSSGADGVGSAAFAGASGVTVANSLLWDNEEQDLVNATVSFSLVEGGYAGVAVLDTDPLLVAAPGYALSASSPCIDAGDASQVPAWASLDIDGNPRALENPLVPDTGFGGTPMVDIGAFEFADGYVLPLGCGINTPGSLTVLSGEPLIGATVTFGIDNPLGTQSAGAIPALLYSLSPSPNACGIVLANFGMAPGAPGALLVGLDLDGIVGAPWAGTGNPAAIAAPLPNATSLIGASIYTQGALVGGGGVGLTNGIELLVGP